MVSEDWLLIESSKIVLLDINNGKIINGGDQGYFGVSSASLSPDRRRLLLGGSSNGYLWDLEGDNFKKLAGLTRNSQALGWFNDSTALLTGQYGGIVRLNVDRFLEKYEHRDEYYDPDGPGQQGFKIDFGEIYTDDMFWDVELDYSTSVFYKKNEDVRVFEILEGERMHEYKIGDKIGYKEIDLEEDHPMYSYPILMVCNENVIIRNTKDLDILDVQTGMRLSKWELGEKKSHIFSNLEGTKLYAYSENKLDELDLDSKTSKSVWSATDVKRISVVGDRLLLLLYENRTVEVVDLTQQKSLLKLAAYKSGEEMVIREV